MNGAIQILLCLCLAAPSFQAELNLFSWGSRTSTSAPSSRCTDAQYRCRSGECINKSYLCDGDRDCPGGEDERNCRGGSTARPSRTTASTDDEECGAGEFDCGRSAGGKYGRCIPNSPTFMCDGVNDCTNGADERNCRRTTEAPTTSYRSGSCKTGEFQCSSGRCLRPNWVCDGDEDCSDGADERNCRGATTYRRTTPTTRRRSQSPTNTRSTVVELKPLHLNGLKVVAANSNRLWYKSSSTKEDCADKCAASAKCKLVTFDKVRKQCTAYDEDVQAKFAFDEDFSTFGRWTENANRFAGVTFTGTDITYDGQPITEWLKITWTEQICMQICHIHPRCSLAVFNTKTNKCSFKTRPTKISPRTDPNYVSVVMGDDYELENPRN